MLILGSRRLAALGSVFLGSVSSAVSARSACPVIIARGPVSDAGADVVVGVDGTRESQTVLAFAFDYASWHRRPLRAVLCWPPDRVAPFLGRLQPPPPPLADEVLSEALAGWREKFPDVAVTAIAVRDYAVLGLVAQADEQHLVVVGSHGHHALAGTLLGSVSQGVLHHATGPVAVVPTHQGD